MKLEESQRINSGYDKWKRNVLRRCLNIASDGADVTCDGRLFHKLAPETGKARLSTVERLNGRTAEQQVGWKKPTGVFCQCQDGTSVTRVKYDDMQIRWCNRIIVYIYAAKSSPYTRLGNFSGLAGMTKTKGRQMNWLAPRAAPAGPAIGRPSETCHTEIQWHRRDARRCIDHVTAPRDHAPGIYIIQVYLQRVISHRRAASNPDHVADWLINAATNRHNTAPIAAITRPRRTGIDTERMSQ